MSALNGFGVHGNVPSIVSSMGGRRVALVAGPSRRYTTIQSAIDAAASGDEIYVDPGVYEPVVIPRTKGAISIVGMGGRGSIAIVGAEDGIALDNRIDGLTLRNIGIEADGATGVGLVNWGRRLRAYGCKIEGGSIACKLACGSVAEIDAGTHKDSADTLFEDCEFAYSADAGVMFEASDYGALTQNFFKSCYFHSLPAASFEESHSAGGVASLHYRGLVIDSCLFGAGDEETDALPTKWISLDDDNANSGLLSKCVFPDILAGGRNLMSTALRSIGNYFVAGIGGAQPS